MRSRADSLELALLGVLSQGPLHGYELRKRMSAIFGPFRALSFSVLYPQLRRMLEAGLIQECDVEHGSRRSRIVYSITESGAERFLGCLLIYVVLFAATGRGAGELLPSATDLPALDPLTCQPLAP